MKIELEFDEVVVGFFTAVIALFVAVLVGSMYADKIEYLEKVAGIIQENPPEKSAKGK